jgi:DNA-directed RNA polymerase subunit RPC12/RpoP
MLTRITCPNCGHIGAATAASLPRVLICSQCGHGAFVKSKARERRLSLIHPRSSCAGMRKRRIKAEGKAKILTLGQYEKYVTQLATICRRVLPYTLRSWIAWNNFA